MCSSWSSPVIAGGRLFITGDVENELRIFALDLQGRALWQVKPYIVFFPAIFLSMTVLAVNLLGDGLRDALDPRMMKRL